MNVTHLQAILQGECIFTAHVDTWKNPGFLISFKLIYKQVPTENASQKPADWLLPLINEQQMNAQSLQHGLLDRKVMIPEKVKSLWLYYYATGHGNNQASAGEFKSRIHLIYINRHWRFMQYSPWRNDGYKYRHINPQSGRWNRDVGEVWSSDFGRSGWMPGNKVEPKIMHVTPNLLPQGKIPFPSSSRALKVKMIRDAKTGACPAT